MTALNLNVLSWIFPALLSRRKEGPFSLLPDDYRNIGSIFIGIWVAVLLLLLCRCGCSNIPYIFF